MSAFSMRPARAEDAAAITAIYNEAILETTATFDTEVKTVEDRAAWLKAKLSNPRHPVWVAETPTAAGAPEVVAFASLSPWSDRRAYDATVENSVYVLKRAWGQGIGTKLMVRVLEEGARAGARQVIAKIADENAVSLAMHARMGFQHVGVLRSVGFKFGRWLDVTLLQKSL